MEDTINWLGILTNINNSLYRFIGAKFYEKIEHDKSMYDAAYGDLSCTLGDSGEYIFNPNYLNYVRRETLDRLQHFYLAYVSFEEKFETGRERCPWCHPEYRHVKKAALKALLFLSEDLFAANALGFDKPFDPSKLSFYDCSKERVFYSDEELKTLMSG